jgi:auxin efflux carrier family protein
VVLPLSLIVTPALVVATILSLNCYTGLLDGVPNLAKLVVMVNSGLPGALIVVVLLKSNPVMADSAAAVAKVYLPTYLLSIVTIAAWTTLGLWITLPDADGNTFCKR